MSKVFPVVILLVVIIALVAGVIAWNMPSSTPLYDTSPTDTYAPNTLVPETAGIDDIATEADTLDVNFDTDIQQLDAELRGL